MESEKYEEWLKGDSKEMDYHTKQYEEPKAYTKQVGEYLKEWNLIETGTQLLDFGCGAGANCHYYARIYPEVTFHGVDINEEYIDLANRYAQSNTHFFAGDFNKLSISSKGYKGILCMQTLSWMENYQDALLSMLHINPEWVLITSLFYDGPVEAQITLKEFNRTVGDKDYRQTYYNVYSLNEFEKFVNEQGYKLAYKEPFLFPFDLAQPKDKGMGTYTRKFEDGTRAQISGPLLMPWYTILLTKA